MGEGHWVIGFKGLRVQGLGVLGLGFRMPEELPILLRRVSMGS